MELKQPERRYCELPTGASNPTDYAEAHHNLGIALTDLQGFEEALASYDRAIALTPDSAETHSSRGKVMRQLKRFEEPLSSYDRAIALKPDYAATHFNQGLCLLLVGNFERGRPEYEWRWETDDFTYTPSPVRTSAVAWQRGRRGPKGIAPC